MKQVDRSWLAVIVAALVVLSACGGPAAAPPTTPPTAAVTAAVTAAPVTVRIQGTGGGTEATLSPLGEKFKSTHPNIRLNRWIGIGSRRSLPPTWPPDGCLTRSRSRLPKET